METRSKKNHNICLLPVIFNFMVRDLFKGKWCHSLPNIKCLSNGSPCIKLSDLGGIVVYTVWMREKGCLKVQIPFKTYYNSNTQPPLQSFHFWNVFIVLQTLLCACKVLLLQIKPPPTTALMQRVHSLTKIIPILWFISYHFLKAWQPSKFSHIKLV